MGRQQQFQLLKGAVRQTLFRRFHDYSTPTLPHHSSPLFSGVLPLQYPSRHFSARNSLTEYSRASAQSCRSSSLGHSRLLSGGGGEAGGGGGEAGGGGREAGGGGEAGGGSAGGEGEKDVQAGGEGGDKSAAEEKPVRRKKLTKKQRFGKYDQDFEDEMAQFPIDESIEDLYDARPIFEEWMGHPTFYDMISADAYPKKGAPKDEPPGEGPILRWETRVVLSPGGEAFHPKNRKVKVSVYVKELKLTPEQRERLLFMVGKRYNPNKDELTIVSERFDQREENRKDVLRTLLALIEEAKKEDDDVHGDAQQA